MPKLYINSILRNNKSLNFVQRVQNPDKYPSLPLPDMGEDMYGTHLMSYGTFDDGTAMVYPMIIQDPKTGNLTKLSPDEAYEYALSSGEHIMFPTEEDASWFTKNYKTVWDKGE
jgi:hypothetical protein